MNDKSLFEIAESLDNEVKNVKPTLDNLLNKLNFCISSIQNNDIQKKELFVELQKLLKN